MFEHMELLQLCVNFPTSMVLCLRFVMDLKLHELLDGLICEPLACNAVTYLNESYCSIDWVIGGPEDATSGVADLS